MPDRVATLSSRCTWVFVFSVFFISYTAATAQGVSEKLEHVMDGYVKNGFNGTVLVARKGAVLLEKGYGYRNVDTRAANDEHTIYRIGQITEALTAEMILKLDSKGQLGLDERIIKYLPNFPFAERISIRNLLTHTSGLINFVPDLSIQRNKVCRPINLQTFTETYGNKLLLFEPGSRYAYSNADYILLGFIIGQIAKVPFEDEMGYKMFTVCGMQRSGFEFASLKDENKATGYADDGSTYSEVSPTGDTGIQFSANAMYSTVGDLYKWHEALRWYKLLPKDWQELAYVPFLSQFALGWDIDRIYNKRFMEHTGSYAGFTSTVIRQEEDDLFIIVLENRMHAGYNNIEIAKSIIKALYGVDTKKQEKQSVTATATEDIPLKRFAGKYAFSSDYSLTVRIREDSLIVESPDQDPITLDQQSTTVFKTKGADVTLEFIPDQKTAAINKVILHQNGQNNTGKRVK